MLKQFTFSNFKSFKDRTTLDLWMPNSKSAPMYSMMTSFNYSVLRAGAVFGANASGKSKLFEAMRFFKLVVCPMEVEGMPVFAAWKQMYDKFRLSTETDNQDSFFEVVFIVDNVQYRYNIELNESGITSESLFIKTQKESLVFSRKGFDVNPVATHIDNNISDTIRSKGWPKSNYTYLWALANFDCAIAKVVFGWFSKVLFVQADDNVVGLPIHILENAKVKDVILKFLKTFDINIDDMSPSIADVDNLPDEVKHIIGNRIDGNTKVYNGTNTFHYKYNENFERVEKIRFVLEKDESMGTRRLTNIILPILQVLAKGGVLFVDEFESSIHPNILKNIVGLFYEKECKGQLVVNSQNVDLLNLEIYDDNHEVRRIFDKNQIFLVEKNRYGVSSVIPLKKFGSKDTRGNIKDKLLSGMYNVGVPYISELDLDEFKQNNKKSLKVFFNKLNLEQ